MFTCDCAGWNIMDYQTTTNFTPVKTVKKTTTTSKETIDTVIKGMVHLGLHKSKAKKIALQMCINKYYDDPQDLFEACFPYIR